MIMLVNDKNNNDYYHNDNGYANDSDSSNAIDYQYKDHEAV